MERHSPVTQITHGAFALAFAGLVFTGAQFSLHAHWIRSPLAVHEVLALVMIACGIAYFVHAAVAGKLKHLIFGASDAAGLIPMTLYYLRLRPEPPPYDRYNPLQKLAYTIVLLMIAPLIVATGLAMWPHFALFRPFARVFGGKHAVAAWHLGFALELLAFFFGHMVMIAATGLRRNLQAMFTAGAPRARGAVR